MGFFSKFCNASFLQCIPLLEGKYTKKWIKNGEKTVLFLTCSKPIFWLISGTTQSVTNFKPIKNWPKSNAKNAFMYTSKNAPKTYCNSILFAFLFSSNRVGHYPKSNFLGTHIQNHLDMG